MLKLTQPYIKLEEKLNTRFDNPTSAADASSDLTLGKESRRRKKDIDMKRYIWYDKYTPLNTSQDKSY